MRGGANADSVPVMESDADGRKEMAQGGRRLTSGARLSASQAKEEAGRVRAAWLLGRPKGKGG